MIPTCTTYLPAACLTVDFFNKHFSEAGTVKDADLGEEVLCHLPMFYLPDMQENGKGGKVLAPLGSALLPLGKLQFVNFSDGRKCGQPGAGHKKRGKKHIPEGTPEWVVKAVGYLGDENAMVPLCFHCPSSFAYVGKKNDKCTALWAPRSTIGNLTLGVVVAPERSWGSAWCCSWNTETELWAQS
jgi:hypothetical protein